MKNNLKSIKERVEEIYQIFDCDAFSAEGEKRIKSDISTTLTQDRHAIGERILEWVESKEKECPILGAHTYEDSVREQQSLGYNQALTDLETFIKSELMNKDV